MAVKRIDARRNPKFNNIVGSLPGDQMDIIHYFLQDTELDDETKALDSNGDLTSNWNNIIDTDILDFRGQSHFYITSHRIANRVQEKINGSLSTGAITVDGETSRESASTNAVKPIVKWGDLDSNQMDTWGDFGTAFNGADWDEIAVNNG